MNQARKSGLGRWLLGCAWAGSLWLAGCNFQLSPDDAGFGACGQVICDGGGDAAGRADMAAADPALPGPRRVVNLPMSLPVSAGTLPYALVGPSDDGVTLSGTGAPFPAVLWFPEQGVAATQYLDYAERLASYGVVTLLPTPRNSGDVTQYLADGQALLAWAGAATGAAAGRIDGGHLGVAGHGLGGKIALLLAEGNFGVKAVFGLDPVDNMAAPTAFTKLSGLRLPAGVEVVLVGETLSELGTAGKAACTPAGQNFQALYNGIAARAMAIEVVEAGHEDFLDGCAADATLCAGCLSGSAPTAQTHGLAVKYSAAYFLWTLGGAGWAGNYLTGAPFLTDQMNGLVTSEEK